MYSFIIAFDDNSYGSANSKGQTPPYGVGDEMNYTITGNFRGTPKIKVQKPGSNFAPPTRSSAPNPVGNTPAPYRQPSQPAPAQRPSTVQTAPINGASVGMAMNQALGLLTRDWKRQDIVAAVCSEDFWYAVSETASDILRVSRHLESGHLAPSVRERNGGTRETVAVETTGGQYIDQQPARNRPSERQMANQSDESDFDSAEADRSGAPF